MYPLLNKSWDRAILAESNTCDVIESDPSGVFSVWDSPIPMSVVSMASLESYLAERSEVWDRPRAAGMFYEEWGSRDPR